MTTELLQMIRILDSCYNFKAFFFLQELYRGNEHYEGKFHCYSTLNSMQI